MKRLSFKGGRHACGRETSITRAADNKATVRARGRVRPGVLRPPSCAEAELEHTAARMDSGIDSTESSNGSLEEGGGAAADVAMEGEAAAAEEARAGEAASSCGEPGLPQPQAAREAAPAALGTQAAAPSNLRTLAAAAVSSATPEAMESRGEKGPRDSSALFKVVRTRSAAWVPKSQALGAFGHEDILHLMEERDVL